VEHGFDIATTRAVEEGAGEQWFLTPSSILKRIMLLSLVLVLGGVAVAWAGKEA